MKTNLKFIMSTLACVILAACGGGGSGGGGSPSPSPSPTVTPPSSQSAVNISNISTIPTGANGQYVGMSYAVIATNNTNDQINLTSATYAVDGGSAQDANGKGSPINLAQCAYVQANNSCSIAVKALSAQGQYMLNLTFTDASNGKQYTAEQIVSYSSAIPSTPQGVMYSSMNTNIYAPAGGAAAFVVPFVITRSGGFTNLSVASYNNNPMLSPSIICAGGAYSEGNSCYVLVRIAAQYNVSNSTIAGGFTVSSSDLSSGSSVKSRRVGTQSSVKVMGTAGYVFGVPVTLTNVTQGNLLTSAINISINPANGNNPQTVTLINNGSANITGISVSANSPLTISGNGCNGTLVGGGAPCTFSVNANSTTSSQSTVTVTYNNGASSGSTTGAIAFNVYYVASGASGALSATANGNLLNVPVNGAESLNVTVTNGMTVPLNNFTFTTPTAAGGNAALSYASAANGSTCLTAGESLPVGSSCTLVVQFNPTTQISAAVFNLTVSANEQPTGTTTTASVGISYSSVTGSATVIIMPSYTSIAIRADGSDSFTESLVLANFGGESADLESFTYPSPTNLTIPVAGSTCTTSTVLSANESSTCYITLKFGPTSAVENIANNLLIVNYGNSGVSFRNRTTYARLDLLASIAALIQITGVTESGPVNTCGGGTACIFTNQPGNQESFTVTYTNTGSATATNFNVALNTLPIGYVNVGGTCSTGSSESNLVATASCTAVFKLVDQSGNLYNPYSYTGSMPFNLPGFSYTDANTGLNTNTAPTCFSGCTGIAAGASQVNVTVNSLSTAVSPSAASWTTANAGGSNTLTFTGGTIGTEIIIPSTSNTFLPVNQLAAPGFTAVTGTTGTSGARFCSFIAGSPTTCSFTVTNESGLPVTTYGFTYIIAPSGSTANGGSGIIQQTGSITYTN